MTAFQRIALVTGLAVAIAGGALVLLLRPAAEPATVTLGAAATATDGDDTQHLGRIAVPETAVPETIDTLLTANRDGPRVIGWDDLVPADGDGAPVSFAQGTREREGMPDREAFGDVTEADIDDFVADIDAMRSLQPAGAAIRTDLDGV